ncbi:hypothetical protein [Luteibacter aegosomatissinici]|uniref:ApeA N-terminal domain 1-containing protein n=1 Tax=Luteibacter aegosomatissinici TaxID=2911539 RepID=UPI003CCD7F5B
MWKDNILGSFSAHDGTSAVGELRLKGRNTILQLHFDASLDSLSRSSHIVGTSVKGERVTLIDCHSPCASRTHLKDEPSRYHADIFPHYAAVGRVHFDPGMSLIRSIRFCVTDSAKPFYDFDAFSHLIVAKTLIDAVL